MRMHRADSDPLLIEIGATAPQLADQIRFEALLRQVTGQEDSLLNGAIREARLQAEGRSRQ